MEGFAECEDFWLSCVEGGNFHRIFVRFRSAVAEEKGVVVVAAYLSQPLCEFPLEGVLHGIGVESQFAQLLADFLHVMRMAVAYRDYCMASVQVGVFHSVLVPKFCVTAFYRLDVPKFIYFE